jgi:Domain of unknown function (DUF5666)
MDQWPSTPPGYGWAPPPPSSALPSPGRRWALAAVIAVAVLAVAAVGLLLLGPARPGGSAALAAQNPGTSTSPASGPTVRRLLPFGGPGPGRFGGRFGFGFGGGTVTAIAPSSITVRGPFGRTTTIATNSSTAYYRDTTKVQRSDLKVGDRVVVNLTDPLASSPTAGAVRIVLPNVVGTVSNVQADSFTLTDEVGFRHTIKTASSTGYSKDGQSSSRSAVVTNGGTVRVAGTIDANGTDMSASSVDAFTLRFKRP